MRIFVMARGGFSVFGGHYDAHKNEGVGEIRNGESRALTIEYPSAPSAPSTSGSGITASTPVVSGKKLTLTLQAINDCGHLDISATVGGEIRVVRVRFRVADSLGGSATYPTSGSGLDGTLDFSIDGNELVTV